MYPLSQKPFIDTIEASDEFTRGTYLIVVPNPDLNSSALSYFINLKKTQGYDVNVISFRQGDADTNGINGNCTEVG